MILKESRNLYIRSFLFLLLVFFGTLSERTNAQLVYSLEEYQTALQHLEDLQSGTLVVMLKSSKKKLDQLEERLNSPKLSRSERKRVTKMLEKEKNDRQYVLDSLVAAITEFYKFSDYRFIYDTDLESFRAGSDSLFLDNNREYDQEIKLNRSRPHYFMMERYTSDVDGSRVYALVLLDHKLNVLDPPFPFFMKLIKIGPIAMLKLLGKKPAYVSLASTIKRLDKRLQSRFESISNMENLPSSD